MLDLKTHGQSLENLFARLDANMQDSTLKADLEAHGYTDGEHTTLQRISRLKKATAELLIKCLTPVHRTFTDRKARMTLQCEQALAAEQAFNQQVTHMDGQRLNEHAEGIARDNSRDAAYLHATLQGYDDVLAVTGAVLHLARTPTPPKVVDLAEFRQRRTASFQPQ